MKGKKRFVFLMSGLILLGCSNAVESPLPAATLTKQRAMELAQDEVREIASGERVYVWNKNSKVTDAFPVYLDGIDGISYYECKVMTDGQESGYVLINVNGSDVTVTEACEEGTTLNEYYEEVTGQAKENIEVYRYGFTASAAYEKLEDISARGMNTENRKPLAVMGLDESFDYESYRDAVRANGGSPLTEVIETSAVSSRGMTGRGNAEVYLRTSWDPNVAPTSTPRWVQFNVDYQPPAGEAAVGCGALAHALVLAYWQEKKDFPGLLSHQYLIPIKINGEHINQEKFQPERDVKSEILQIAIDLGTTKALSMGYTAPYKMKRIDNYVNSKGYSCSVRERFGGYDSKFNGIYDSLAEDRPVILLINADGIGAMDHYVVVEHAKRVSGSNAYIRYYCNFAWGEWAFTDTKSGGWNSHKWVYAFNMKDPSSTSGGLAAARHSVYQYWDIKISK